MLGEKACQHQTHYLTMGQQKNDLRFLDRIRNTSLPLYLQNELDKLEWYNALA
jgi:hypothetical protein